MARVKLELPDSFPFRTELSVGIGHINYGGHLGNDSALTLVHEVRLRFLQSLGLTELDIGGLGMILTDAVLIFKSEVFWGETLVAEVASTEFNKYGCDLFYRFRKQADNRDALHAKTGILFFDYTIRKPASVPVEFLSALGMQETPT
ncbi:thioesterase family protein [Chitinimonas sp. BJB300]|uniref:thioesterase family protein n=1 Tax=Chitinimonas sp. BJB300 TaxID=1559339 RepID=UPI000C0F2574|nr:thioesterase family protein [Chitinimonas sp. BJB300]PHV11825.1 thioesterase [Chitinimonas sp. BJB300]TSJ87036.1 thioesterase [Chitinimonas sp. BJB300]